MDGWEAVAEAEVAAGRDCCSKSERHWCLACVEEGGIQIYFAPAVSEERRRSFETAEAVEVVGSVDWDVQYRVKTVEADILDVLMILTIKTAPMML